MKIDPKQLNLDLEEVCNYWLTIEGTDTDEFEASDKLSTLMRKFLFKLPKENILDAINITFSRFGYNHALYFSGVCWSMIKEKALDEESPKP